MGLFEASMAAAATAAAATLESDSHDAMTSSRWSTATKKIAEAREAEAFIRAHGVQAVREGGEGNFAMTVQPTHQDVTIGDANEDEGGGCGSNAK